MTRRALILLVIAAGTVAGWAAALWGSWVAGRDIERWAAGDITRDRGQIDPDIVERVAFALALGLFLLVTVIALTLPDPQVTP